MQTLLLTRPVEQVARPATVVCLCCRGWVGDRAQEFVYQVPPVLAPAQRNRTAVSSQNCAADSGPFCLLLVQFLQVSQGAVEEAFWNSTLFSGTGCSRCQQVI